MKTLKLSSDLSLPLDAVTQTFAFLARRGAGKTYGASKLCEEMLLADAQCVVIDPIGSWYALRIGADGKTKGFPVAVFGGLHGDLPLTPESGPLLAELIVDRNISAVLDVSMMRKGDRKRFAAEFAERFFDRKKSHRTPVHLFVEEAQVFVPQRVMPDEARMLGAFEDIVKLGRNFGVGVTLISQRPQSVNKDALNQTECLVVLQTNGSQERKALKEWIVDQGLDIGELIDTLPGLQKGEAWVWSPSWLGTTKRIRIGQKRTFNASATPEAGQKAESRPLAPVDLEHLREAMQATVDAASASDPKALRARIVALERQLAAKPAAVTQPAKTVEKPALSAADLKAIEMTASRLSESVDRVLAALKPVADALAAVKGAALRPVDAAARRSTVPPRAPARQPSAGGLGRGERAMLEALASMHPTALTRNQVAMLSGYSAGGGTFAKYLSTLKASSLVEVYGEQLSITDAGQAAAGPVAPVPPSEVVGMWRSKLGGGEQKLFDELVKAYPDSIDKVSLGSRTGYEASGGTFAKYVSTLKSIGVVEGYDGGLRASADLFFGGAT